ncbi:DoxX family protein [Lysobacter sp. Root494]|nr:DoxX family protein [Lysobacter sp. Root494]
MPSTFQENTLVNAYLSLLGRVGLSLIFIISGWGKIGGYAATQGYMDAMGVPGALLPLVIALELGGGLAILAGVFTRWTALALAVFSVASAMLFHANLADQVQAIMFWKNFAIAGGFLLLAANGPGALSLESRLVRRTAIAH